VTGAATQVLAWALGQVGTTEHPAGSNMNPYAALAGHANGQPWCASFAVAACRSQGVVAGNESAFTPSLAASFKQSGTYLVDNPEPGDLVFFDFPDDVHRIQHVGLVQELFTPGRGRAGSDGILKTIEGNTSAGKAGSQSNGGMVARRARSCRDVVCYGRPLYAPPEVHPVSGSPAVAVAQLRDARTTVYFADGHAWLSAGPGSGPTAAATARDLSVAGDVAGGRTTVTAACASGDGVLVLLASGQIIARYAVDPGDVMGDVATRRTRAVGICTSGDGVLVLLEDGGIIARYAADPGEAA
jgi:hypothetical protein